MPYTVTRQRQWPDGTPVVEVSRGGLDYTNPDALTPRDPGEMETYRDPREAVDAAISICQAWRRDGEKRARVGVGSTLGMTMPFEPTNFGEAQRWAKKEWEKLPKCDRCGEILTERPYRLPDSGDKFCREYCAEEAWKEANIGNHEDTDN